MKAIKAKELIVPTALELNIPVSDVNDVVTSYYRMVREALTELKDVKVHLSHLGDFFIKHWMIEKNIDKFSSIKNKFENMSNGIKKETIIAEMNYRLHLMQEVKCKLKLEEERKSDIKKNKYEKNNIKNITE